MSPQPTATASTWTERLFKIALLVKGIDGAFELVGAVVLLLVTPAALEGLTHDVLSHDLLGAPDSALATHFATSAGEFASGGRLFAIVYLGLHGVLKLGLVWALLRRILPAYPVALLVLVAFVVYEIYRATRTHSVVLPVFAAIDVVIIVLVIREYRELRRQRAAATS